MNDVPHMTPEEFREHGHAMVEWIATYLDSVEEYPVLSQVQPGEIRDQLPPDPPQEGESFDAMIPFLIEGGAGNYLETIARFVQTLEVEVIVPGHGLLTSGAIFGRYLRYLSELIDSVRQATRAGRTLEETLARTHLADQYTPPADSPLARLGSFITSVHRWNVQQTYQEANER